jgi:hypothetical protein
VSLKLLSEEGSLNRYYCFTLFSKGRKTTFPNQKQTLLIFEKNSEQAWNYP